MLWNETIRAFSFPSLRGCKDCKSFTISPVSFQCLWLWSGTVKKFFEGISISQIIQLAGDADLVRRAQVDVFTLRAIPQRGIIEKDFGGHSSGSYMQTGNRSRPGPGFSADADTKSARLEEKNGFR